MVGRWKDAIFAKGRCPEYRICKFCYNEFPYAEEFNRLEDNLELLRNSTFIFNNEEKKTWYANEKTPDFEDFNRIERICLDYYNGLQRYRPRRLSITLGMATTDLKI